MTNLSKELVRANGLISYTDNTGDHVLDVPEGSSVMLSANAVQVFIQFDGNNHTLTNVTQIEFKGITATNLVPFYLHKVTKVTLDSVDFKAGIDFSGMTDLETLIVKDSKFGSLDYSLAIHSAPKLTIFSVNNSEFNADLRIYDNKILESSDVSDSVFEKDALQYNNKDGYYTDFIGNTFVRKTVIRLISSGGMSNHDIFYINRNGNEIGQTKFDAANNGSISYKDSTAKLNTLNVPAGVSVKTVLNVLDKITITLTNGTVEELNNVKELTFKNVNIETHVAFTQLGLKIEKIAFINSRTQLIDLANSTTLKSVKVVGTEISQLAGYLSVYNNSALESFEMQESSVEGTSGYISVYANNNLTKFVMNDVYTYGYLSAYNLGGTNLQISNSQFDDYIATNEDIEGEGERVVIGDAPVIEGAQDITLEKGEDFDPLAGITANDTEDGDLTSSIIVEGQVDTNKVGEYPVTYTVTDSDGNVTTVTIIVTVE